jgi:DNA-binding beta-propeller fold protein YncE
MATIPVGDKPYVIEYTPDGAHAFVANYEGNSISVIRLSDKVEVKKIPLSDRPRVMQIDDDGTWLYVGCTDGTFYTIFVDGDDSVIYDSRTIPSPMCGLGISEELQMAVVSHVNTDTVSLISFSDIDIPDLSILGLSILILMIPLLVIVVSKK